MGRVGEQPDRIVILPNLVCTALLPYQSQNCGVFQRDAEAQLCEARSGPIDLHACQHRHIHVCSDTTRGIASPTISVKTGFPRCSSRCPHFECCLPWQPMSRQRHEAHDNFRCAHRLGSKKLLVAEPPVPRSPDDIGAFPHARCTRTEDRTKTSQIRQ